jgi:DNA-binding transcriptional MerR regulator
MGSTHADLASIGEIARRAGVATSTVRYYERRGLLQPDTREGGQRRYGDASLRRLVFIGMLKDTGLTLDDIEGVIGAATNEEWKAIGWRRLHALDEEIARLQRARTYLLGALECPFDHPLTQCGVMGAEIDRRLGSRKPSKNASRTSPALSPNSS